MITIGENVVARGRLVERDDHEICLGFWGGGEGPWPDGVRVPREYPAVQLLASAAPDLLPLRGRNVEVRGRWDAEGRIRVDQASPAERSTPSTPSLTEQRLVLGLPGSAASGWPLSRIRCSGLEIYSGVSSPTTGRFVVR